MITKGSLGFAVGALALGMLATPVAMRLGDLSRLAPGLALPAWLFALVWTIIYPALGIAAWRVWQQRERPGAAESLMLFGVCFLFLWSFTPIAAAAQRQLVTAMLDVVGLLLSYAAAWGFRRVERAAFLWMLPLLGWMPLTTTLKWVTLSGS